MGRSVGSSHLIHPMGHVMNSMSRVFVSVPLLLSGEDFVVNHRPRILTFLSTSDNKFPLGIICVIGRCLSTFFLDTLTSETCYIPSSSSRLMSSGKRLGLDLLTRLNLIRVALFDKRLTLELFFFNLHSVTLGQTFQKLYRRPTKVQKFFRKSTSCSFVLSPPMLIMISRDPGLSYNDRIPLKKERNTSNVRVSVVLSYICGPHKIENVKYTYGKSSWRYHDLLNYSLTCLLICIHKSMRLSRKCNGDGSLEQFLRNLGSRSGSFCPKGSLSGP